MAEISLDRDECRPGCLPPVCMACGAPCSEVRPLVHRFRWLPLWVCLLVPLVIGYVILQGMQRRTRTVGMRFCRHHRLQWRDRYVIMVLLIVTSSTLTCAVLWLGAKAPIGWRFSWGFGISLCGLIIYLVVCYLYRPKTCSIQVVRIDEEHIKFVGLHCEFVVAVAARRAMEGANYVTFLDSQCREYDEAIEIGEDESEWDLE